MDNTPTPKVESHKDFGLILSEEQALQVYHPSYLQNLRTHTPQFCLQPITIYTSQAIHITGKIPITLLLSVMAPSFNERYTSL